jgi:hypothetical protein
MAESGCVVMGDLLHVDGSGAPNAFFNRWPLLTPLFLDPRRQVESLGQPPKPSDVRGWRNSIIYPVAGLIVKGILAREGWQTPPARRRQAHLGGDSGRYR